MDEKEFALRLAQLRQKKNVSAREMSLAIGQNAGYINNIESGKSLPSLPGVFYICDYFGITVLSLFDNLVDKEERIPVGYKAPDAVDIYHCRDVRIIYGSLDFSMLNLMAHHSGELIVDSMTRAHGYYPSLDLASDQSEVADEIHHFMTSRLIVPYKGFRIDISELVDLHVRHIHHIADMIDAILRNLLVIYHDCIIEIATLDKVCCHELFNLAHEYESACFCHFLSEVRQIVEHSELVGKHR